MQRWMTSFAMGAAIAAAPVGAEPYPQPLPVEEIPAVTTLPATYPAGWIFAHDLYFPSITDGRVAIVDPGDPHRPLKGQVRSAQFGSFLASARRHELYSAETFYSRLTRGERTDAVTIWDMATLQPKGEVLLPGNKRGQAVTQPAAFELIDGDRLALLWNFTPASSVSVIDLDSRKVIAEIDTPGCSLNYPTGPRGFYTLCSSGALTSFALNADGTVASQSDSKPFNRIDDDPLFMMRSNIGGIDYFPTFLGRVQPIDARGAAAKLLPAWSLVTPAEAKDGWRPSGWQVVSSDAAGRLFVLMQSGGSEGSHKNGGSEVWVFDPAKKQRVQRIALKHAAISIEVTRGAPPRLVAAALQGGMDVYDAATGGFQHSLPAGIAQSPMVMRANR